MYPAALRIIDANLNRAREGLRVLEEHARFVQDDPALTERLKRLRHALVEASRGFGIDALLTERDIQHDVGTRISTVSEQSRACTTEVAAAAGKRVSEALRCIEEYGKIINVEPAGRVEQLRYELYAVEQDILIAGPRRQRLRAARLFVLVTEALCNGPWLTVCEQALAGGPDVLQLREKSLSDRELLHRARELRELTRVRGVLLFINDRPDIARLVGADGIHVGQDDLPVSDARRIAGGGVLVGKSTHSIEQARHALAESPDYIAVGPMFASKTKPGIEVQGPRLLEEVSAMTELPIVAIGGIDEANVAILKPRRAFCVAVCQAIISSPNPAAAARAVKEATRAAAAD